MLLNFNPRLRGIAIATCLGLLGTAWSGALLADTPSKCLSDGNTCLALSSSPSGSVQPSQLGGTPTFVRYNAQLTRTNSGSGSRTVFVTLFASPQTAITDLQVTSNDSDDSCQINSNQSISCQIDKFANAAAPSYPVSISFTLAAPTYAQVANKEGGPYISLYGDFGNQCPGCEYDPGIGNNRSVDYDLLVSQSSGATYVPANTAATVVTAPETANPANQTSATMPLFAKVSAPPRSTPYLLSVAVAPNPDGINFNCPPLGISLTLNDGGPYLCRQTSDPTLAVIIDAQSDFPATDPLKVTLISDQSIISPLQLAPTVLTPKGTPAYAFFYNGLANEVRAEADDCASPSQPAPCVLARTRYSTGDWSIVMRKANDGSEPASGLGFLNINDLIFGKSAFAQTKPTIKLR